ncbi:MAG TPA: hypothetical protein VFQ80_07820 [Thermomicrobiales bacterium]|nr:hypothetical protein [Thermomicrobiales bacterium]
METPTAPLAARIGRTALAVTAAPGSPAHAGEPAPLTPVPDAGVWRQCSC